MTYRLIVHDLSANLSDHRVQLLNDVSMKKSALCRFTIELGNNNNA
jgi:hypothetical protein